MSTPFICPLPQWKAIFRRGKQDTRKITHHRASKESLARALANFSPSIWKTNWTQTVLCLRVENRIRPQSWKFCPEANSATEPKPVPIHDELSLSAERRSPVTVAQLVRDESFLHCRPVGLSYSVGRFSLSWISFFLSVFFCYSLRISYRKNWIFITSHMALVHGFVGYSYPNNLLHFFITLPNFPCSASTNTIRSLFGSGYASEMIHTSDLTTLLPAGADCSRMGPPVSGKNS